MLACFDIETRSNVDLKRHGTMRYATDPSTEVITLCVLWEDGTELTWAPEHRGGTGEGLERWNDWVDSGGLCVAWNAIFDRTVLAHVTGPVHAPSIEQTVDGMAQAENFSLPGRLDFAARALGLGGKLSSGKLFINQFSNGYNPWTPTEEELRQFWAYCMQDVRLLKDVWTKCRAWSADEWTDYHVLERMNARGVPIDAAFAAAAAGYGAELRWALDRELQALTGDRDITLAHSKRKLDWLLAQLGGSALCSALNVVKMTKNGKKTGPSASATALQALQEAWDEEPDPNVDWGPIETFMDILARGNGVAVKKFVKMEETHFNERLYGQYRCSPTVTGRHAARGVQLDNLVRDTLDDPEGAMELVMNGRLKDIEEYDLSGKRLPASKVLARLIRPTILAEKGLLTWGDWSSIEARVLPWLADCPAAEQYLDVFRQGGDIYCTAAAGIYGGRAEDVRAGVAAGDPEMKRQRFVGKVATLSLGYQGGAGALMRMAAAYGVRLEAQQAEDIKEKFRAANGWLVGFWDALRDAPWACLDTPGKVVKVGRVRYIRRGSNLYAVLPCGKPLTYPDIRRGKVKKTWKGKEREVDALLHRKVFSGGVTRGELYGGRSAENVTQGAAASLLRDLMRRLDALGLPLIAVRHDEVLLEGSYKKELLEEMLRVPAWAEGLPLAADVSTGEAYGK